MCANPASQIKNLVRIRPCRRLYYDWGPSAVCWENTMRLTLRTLLAYLDDILEPAQAKEIGEKLNESSFASSLVSRIREVMRRRRLTAPTLSGPGVGIDPNTVAEYL